MTETETGDDVRVEAHVTVPVAPDAAFGAFTAGLGTWWPAAYSWGPDTLDRHALEPVLGGRVTEHGTAGTQLDWGIVTAWDPPARVVLDWMVGLDRAPCPDSPSRVTVGFHLDGSSTRVVVVHDRFEAHGDDGTDYAAMLDGEGGWQWILDGFAATLDG